MARPLVAVFQEFATITLPTPAAADLNTCVAAVATQVVDYDAANPSNTRVVDSGGDTVTFDSSVDASNWAPPNLLAGAVLESASVMLRNPEILVKTGTGVSLGAYVSQMIFPDIEGTGGTVEKGHKAYGKNSTGAWVALGDVIEVDASETGTSHTVSLNKDIPNTIDVTAVGGVVITKTLAGDYDVRESDISLSDVDNTVQLLPTAAVTDSDGNVVYVKRASDVHMEYVARRTDLNYIQTVVDVADAETKLGKADPRNPLGLAVYLALLNSGTSILAYGVREDTEAEYALFQRVAMPRSDIYCIVPVCLDPEKQLAVVQALKAKVAVVADAQQALKTGVPQRFKMVIAGGFPAVPNPKKVATVSASAEASDTDTDTVIEITDPTAEFYDVGVRVGDALTTDATTWFGSGVGTVTRVISNTVIQVRATTGTAASALATAVNSDGVTPVYVTRKMEEEELVANLAEVPKSVASKRVVMLAGDQVTVPAITAEMVSAAYLACAVGGMVAGLPPHSGITNLSIAGIADITGTHDTFEEANLSLLSEAGWCIFVEDAPSAAPYCLHGVTSDPSALEFSEIMAVKNFDYVASTLSNTLKQFLGTWNINAETMGFISGTLNSVMKELVARRVPKLGAPLVSGSLDSVAQHPDAKDRIEIYATLQMPMSLNTIGLHLVSA